MKISKFVISSLFITLLLSTTAFSQNKSNGYIEVKEKNKVCMVNNVYNPMADFSKFKVTLDKKDYYGCCAMCEATLTSQKEIREAIDPFSNKKIDKAEAFIVADKNDDGKVLYFENKENFEKFLAE